MFSKKKCENCGEKINDSYNFCPYCRISLGDFEDDMGMLGKNDLDFFENMKMPMGFNTLFNSVLKNLNKQFTQMDEQERKIQKFPKGKTRKSGISISISTSQGKSPEIKIKSFGNSPQDKQERIEKEVRPFLKSFTEKDAKEFSRLPKKEPSTEVRRLSNKVIYEMKLPGVKSLDKISINQFENSIEIKALTKEKAYSKIIPINLPIKKYNLEKGKLILELDARD